MDIQFKRTAIATTAVIALIIGCIDRSLSVNDPDYPDDGYSIAPEWSLIDTNNLRPIALYRIPMTLGKDAFKSLSAHFSNDTILDTAIFNRELQNNRIALYFISSGVCTLTIDGMHPNNRHTTVSKALRIKNPYRISGDSLFGLRETGNYTLLPSPLSDSTNLDLVTGWQLDTGAVTALAPPDTFAFSFIQTGRMTLRALLIDTLYGHRLLVDSITISVPGNRPAIDSLHVITDTLFPGQQPRIQVFANDVDSGSLKTVIRPQKKGGWTDTFNLTGPLMYSSILTGRIPLTDTGTVIFIVTSIDASNLVSGSRNGSIEVVANPPVVRFIPDTNEIALLVDIQQTVLVSATADTFVWTIDGEDTVTDTNRISRIFLTDEKKTANVSVYGIDRYGYRGPMRSVRIVEETNAYDCTLYDPGDSCYADKACWTAKTTRRDRVNEYNALFYWTIFRAGDSIPLYRDTLTPVGDSSSTLCLGSLSIAGAVFDSIDLKIAVVLKDTVGENQVSPTRTQICILRPFRPILHFVDVVPRSDSIASNQEVFVRFEAKDVNRNGSIDSIFWKATGTTMVTALPPSVDSITFAWTTEGPASLLIWARDNDGEYSDTVRLTFEVVENRPRITNMMMNKALVFALERCTLSVSAERGILRSPVEKTAWHFKTGASVSDTVAAGASITVSFATPGKKAVSIVAIDARGDSSLPFMDSIVIDTGKPVVNAVSCDTAAGGFWVNDQLDFTVDAGDPNGSVIQYRIVLRKLGSADSMVTQSTSSRIPFIVPLGNEGVYEIIAYARDNDSLWSTRYRNPTPLTIRRGKPRLSADIPAESWMYDTVSVQCSALDTNGLIGKLICDWADGSVDTITPAAPAQSVADTFVHRYVTAGTQNITISAIDDDGLVTANTAAIVLRKGAPTVHAAADTFVWYDNKGYPGDTLNFKASASDLNGTIVGYVWILKEPLDSSAKAPDTVITQEDYLVAGSANAAFWGDHQPMYFKTDSTYKAAVYAIDDDGQFSAPDTFYFYIDAPRSPVATVEAKDGFNGNRSIFELTGGTSSNDSLIIKLQNIAQNDTNYLQIRISLIVDSLTVGSSQPTIFNDTISIADDTSFSLIKTFKTKQDQSAMRYNNSSWYVAYRPYSSDFIKYKQPFGTTPWLYFRTLVELRLRTGVLQKAVSPQSIKMSHTLTTFE